MKKIISILLIALFGCILILGISNSIDVINYNNELSEDAVSKAYIQKNTTNSNDEVIFGESKDLETGSANIVTSIIANYRSFDTLGEVTVLFVSAIGVSLLIGVSDKYFKRDKSGFILRSASGLLFPVLLVTGVYIFTHGHLTPGGGFPGGSMIASSFLLLYAADDKFKAKMNCFKLLEGFSGTLYVVAGIIGLLAGTYFLENFLPTGTVGNLISAGIIPIIYVLIGLKVGSEVTGIISDFLKEEVES